jgi:dipeptide/tripeptide permease
MMPYVAFIVVFWAVYNQMNTNFVTQGMSPSCWPLLGRTTVF